MQGYAGWMSLTGEPDGPPTKTGLSLVDLGAGTMASLGMVSAIFPRQTDGLGVRCGCESVRYGTGESGICGGVVPDQRVSGA